MIGWARECLERKRQNGLSDSPLKVLTGQNIVLPIVVIKNMFSVSKTISKTATPTATPAADL